MNFANVSPPHLLAEEIEKHFPGMAFMRRLEEQDSYLTNVDYAAVIQEIDDPTLADSCDNAAFFSEIDVTLYERMSCAEPGALKALDMAISSLAKDLVGEWGLMRISNVYRRSGRMLPHLDDDFRARVLTLAINYEVCNG